MDLQEIKDVSYVSWHDLRPGATLDLFGKDVTIEDADAFTKRFFVLQVCCRVFSSPQFRNVFHAPCALFKRR